MTLSQSATAGLRERQKQQRRDAIMDSARALFERLGIEDSTMAMIAAEAGVSTPTVFNYFGSRDELLLAIIFQGHQEAIDHYRRHIQRQTDSLADDLCELLSDLTERSLEIFSKPVWRYAESTAIRYPQSEFVKRYSQIDDALIRTISDMLVAHDCRTRRGGTFDADALATIIYNHWLVHYLACLKDETMTLETHLARVLPEIRHLLDLIFEDA
ncbi:TetR/AcrR family transcriptional regulator [Rhizobium sp. C4]|uniref:TetR/AcrR family transcriptional regulator n=1 Tax=Rhizobium sp. C4 TaxID=1349800 RepID=UPI001E2A841E|nr:TetR/AcrR family transcriptional regulator [Rhizobium sp. C4]MCD2175503.1 TetR/AcrR family transcriptional regulator [Rhizobium sp. C4]